MRKGTPFCLRPAAESRQSISDTVGRCYLDGSRDVCVGFDLHRHFGWYRVLDSNSVRVKARELFDIFYFRHQRWNWCWIRQVRVSPLTFSWSLVLSAFHSAKHQKEEQYGYIIASSHDEDCWVKGMLIVDDCLCWLFVFESIKAIPMSTHISAWSSAAQPYRLRKALSTSIPRCSRMRRIRNVSANRLPFIVEEEISSQVLRRMFLLMGIFMEWVEGWGWGEQCSQRLRTRWLASWPINY